MKPTLVAAAATAALVASASLPALARGGGNGGDREPAGGAFMSSYPQRGSTGVQAGGPPRSVDVPRDANGVPLGRYPGGGYGPAPYGQGWSR